MFGKLNTIREPEEDDDDDHVHHDDDDDGGKVVKEDARVVGEMVARLLKVQETL